MGTKQLSWLGVELVISRLLVQFPARALWSVIGQDSLFHIASVFPAANWVYLALIRHFLEPVRYMLPTALEYSMGDGYGFRVYRPARGRRLCEQICVYKTINRIPM